MQKKIVGEHFNGQVTEMKFYQQNVISSLLISSFLLKSLHTTTVEGNHCSQNGLIEFLRSLISLKNFDQKLPLEKANLLKPTWAASASASASFRTLI